METTLTKIRNLERIYIGGYGDEAPPAAESTQVDFAMVAAVSNRREVWKSQLPLRSRPTPTVVALRETIRLMAEIDAAIPGWPLS